MPSLRHQFYNGIPSLPNPTREQDFVALDAGFHIETPH